MDEIADHKNSGNEPRDGPGIPVSRAIRSSRGRRPVEAGKKGVRVVEEDLHDDPESQRGDAEVVRRQPEVGRPTRHARAPPRPSCKEGTENTAPVAKAASSPYAPT